jgi:hypothetical protein
MDVERLFPEFIPLQIGIKPWLGSLIMQCFAIHAAIYLVAVYFFRLGFCLMLPTGRKVFQYISVIRADSPQ